MHLFLRMPAFNPLRTNPRFVRLFAETAPPAEAQ